MDFPRGPVDKNLPANAGDMGLIPRPGRLHMAVEQLSPWATATEARVPHSLCSSTGGAPAMSSPSAAKLTTPPAAPKTQRNQNKYIKVLNLKKNLK